MTPKPRGRSVGAVVVVVVAVAYLVGGGLALLHLPAALLENWVPDGTTEERGKLLGQSAQIVLFGLGGIIAVVGVTLSILRHREELAAAERDRLRREDDLTKEATRKDEAHLQRRSDAEREMRSRFVIAVDLLSSTASIKRTAALYALAALADDWDTHGRTDEVQVCIDVICGYLRAPIPLERRNSTDEDKEVKAAGFALIAERLRQGSTHSWSAKRINLSRSHIDLPLNFTNATLTDGGIVNLEDATVSDGGIVNLDGVSVSARGRVNLDRATVSGQGRLSLNRATVSEDGWLTLDVLTINDGGLVHLHRATVKHGGMVSLHDSTVTGGILRLSVMTVSGGSVLMDGLIVNNSGRVGLSRITVVAGGRLSLDEMNVSDSEVRIPRVTVGQGGMVSLDGLTVNEGGKLVLSAATVEDGGIVDITGATVKRGGVVDLGRATVADGGLFHKGRMFAHRGSEDRPLKESPSDHGASDPDSSAPVDEETPDAEGSEESGR